MPVPGITRTFVYDTYTNVTCIYVMRYTVVRKQAAQLRYVNIIIFLVVLVSAIM